ncbi:hypothetical protein Taro_050455 [Colocasia esculenta]|uniref:Secreted protein n=1 Tax=Colocasia esculenta TaxID=4460 RepID=A0A843XDX4_COLES|nr:hypothetical protein [Colocasia esculenta]
MLLFWLVCSGGFSQNCALVVLVEVLPGPACVDRPLSILVEVLPRSALCSFQATVVLPLGGPSQGWFILFWLLLLSLSVEMSCCCCRLDCLCYSLLGHFRSRCCALGRASGCCVGQLVSLFVSMFSRSCWWDFVCLRGSNGLFHFPVPSVLLQMVVCAATMVRVAAPEGAIVSRRAGPMRWRRGGAV